MTELLERDRASLNKALSALTDLHVNLDIVSKYLKSVRREASYSNLHFNSKRELIGISSKRDATICHLQWSEECFEALSNCTWLQKHLDELLERYQEADKAIVTLPARLLDKLDAMTKTPWIASVRCNCLDNIMKWPGEMGHQASYGSEKVLGSVEELLEKAEKYDPFPTWEDFIRLLQQYGHELFAIRHYVLPLPSEQQQSPDMPDREALGKRTLAVLDVIEKEGPIAGKVIAARVGVEESTLRRHHLPPLRPFGVQNDRTGDGYYVSHDGES